jgi:hypothetical protein
MSKIDITKPVETLDGEPVTLLSTNARGDFPLLGYRGAREYLTQWTAEGNFFLSEAHPELNLRNAKPKPVEVVQYLNVYAGSHAYGYNTRAEADDHAGTTRIACHRVVLAEGQYDE